MLAFELSSVQTVVLTFAVIQRLLSRFETTPFSFPFFFAKTYKALCRVVRIFTLPAFVLQIQPWKLLISRCQIALTCTPSPATMDRRKLELPAKGIVNKESIWGCSSATQAIFGLTYSLFILVYSTVHLSWPSICLHPIYPILHLGRLSSMDFSDLHWEPSGLYELLIFT